jgi:hypothetical protein
MGQRVQRVFTLVLVDGRRAGGAHDLQDDGGGDGKFAGSGAGDLQPLQLVRRRAAHLKQERRQRLDAAAEELMLHLAILFPPAYQGPYRSQLANDFTYYQKEFV